MPVCCCVQSAGTLLDSGSSTLPQKCIIPGTQGFKQTPATQPDGVAPARLPPSQLPTLPCAVLPRSCPHAQKRKWLGNAALLAAPFLICCLLWVMQEVINKQLDSRAFRCGCKCTSCCDWVSTAGSNSSSNSSGNGSPGSGSDIDSGGSTYTCYEATDERPCSPYAKCQVGAAPCSALPLQTALLPGLPHNFIVAVQHVP